MYQKFIIGDKNERFISLKKFPFNYKTNPEFSETLSYALQIYVIYNQGITDNIIEDIYDVLERAQVCVDNLTVKLYGIITSFWIKLNSCVSHPEKEIDTEVVLDMEGGQLTILLFSNF